MASYTTAQLRNVVLIGHSSSGKTTLAESMVFNTGATSRRGRVEDGTTVADWDDEEIRRRISVGTSVVPCEHKGHKINVLDTPGFIDFVGETKGAIAVADAGIVLLDPVSGVEVGTELGWGYLDEADLPRVVFINKMDRDNASFENTLANLDSQLKAVLETWEGDASSQWTDLRGRWNNANQSLHGIGQRMKVYLAATNTDYASTETRNQRRMTV